MSRAFPALLTEFIMMGNRSDVRTTVLRTGVLAPPDLFGRVFDAVIARREDTGAEGVVSYGPRGFFVFAGPEGQTEREAAGQ